MTPTPYAVFPAPWHAVCAHNLEAIERVEPTCTEDGNFAYWHCTICDKYYDSANAVSEVTLASRVDPAKGHSPVKNPEVPPTASEQGWTQGWRCSVCGVILEEPQPIPIPEPDQCYVEYVLHDQKDYLQTADIDNPNPEIVDTSTKDYTLKGPSVAGFAFDGWYTESTGGTKVTKITKGETEPQKLYARWTETEYTIQFDSPDVPWSDLTYKTSTGRTLTSPAWFGYTFVGWSYNGEIVSSIPPGTTGDITLHANWTSNRNRATAVQQLKNPQIIEDLDNANILFVYEIGQIDNVPLSWDEQNVFSNTEGISINKEVTFSKTVDDTQALKIANTVANATTKSSSWTLSEEWNNTTSASSEHDEQIGTTEGKVDQYGVVTGKKYYVSNSEGGATSTQVSRGGANATSSKVTRDASVGISGEYTANHELAKSVTLTNEKTNTDEFDWNLGGNYGRNKESSLGANLGAEEDGVKAGISAGLKEGSNWGINGGIGGKNTTSNTTGVERGTEHTVGESFTLGQTRNYNVGTENSRNSENHWDISSSSSSNWNTTTGYETSSQTSQNTEVSKTISTLVYDKLGYSSMESRTEGNSNTKSTGESQTLTDEYASTVEFSTEERSSETKHVSISSSATGCYRLITAVTLHVFGVVGYDVASNSFYTYSYSVLDKERHDFLDYSKVNNGLFNDCENGELPLEIPYDVYDYISVKIGRSDGLTINEETGIVTGFESIERSTDGHSNECVVVPEYISASDDLNKPTAVRITGISADAFKGKTHIKAVILPYYITEIPAHAFEGCTSLETVIAYGVTSIGEDAFKGCTSLNTFVVDEYVTVLGNNAFEGVTEVYFGAANVDVAKAAIQSGAKHLIVALHVTEGNLDNYTIEIPDTCDFFALLSSGKTYHNLGIHSDAQETFISNIKMVDNANTPLVLTSEEVTLSKVTVENSPGFAMILLNDNTDLKLYGRTTLTSQYENTVLSKSVTLSPVKQLIEGILNMSGNYLICGEWDSNSVTVTFDDGEVKYLTTEEFDAMLATKAITFDANGGTVAESESIKFVSYGQAYGLLPVPTREYCVFEGWFTEREGGNQITEASIKSTASNETLYAHWRDDTYVLTFNANGGTASETQRTAFCNKAIGGLPTASLDYYSFDGWFTEESGGSKVTSASSFSEATTLYAHWTIHPLSEWTLLEDVPEDAQTVQTEYRFLHRYYDTYDKSEKDGWEHYDTRRTDWGDTIGPVYSDPTNGTRNVWSESYVTGYNKKTEYNYSRWQGISNGVKHWGPVEGTWSGVYCGTYQERGWGGQLTYIRTTYSGQVGGNFDTFNRDDDAWYNQVTRQVDNPNSPIYGTRWYYQEPVYTYYFYQDRDEKDVIKPSGEEYSNIQTWVRYRAK